MKVGKNGRDFQTLRLILSLSFILAAFGSQKGLSKPKVAVRSQGPLSASPARALSKSKSPKSDPLFGDFGNDGTDRAVLRPSAHSAHTIEDAWREFQLSFGQDLVAEWTPDGHLVSVKGASGVGMISPDFDPKDPRSAIERANEVLKASAPLLEIDPEWPLGNAAARSGELSAQVFFQQTYNEVPLAPVGNVKIDLGRRGELLALYSNYAPHVQIINQLRMDSSEARSHVQETGQIEGGGKVIWVTGTVGGVAQGRHAYQFSVRGHYIVVDGETGATLVHRDMRDY